MQPGGVQFPFLGSLTGRQVALGAPAIQRPALSVLLVLRNRSGLEEGGDEFSSSLPRKNSDQLGPKTRAPESLETSVIARDPWDLGW